MTFVLIVLVVLVAVARRPKKRDPQQEKRARGDYPYHNGPFS